MPYTDARPTFTDPDAYLEHVARVWRVGRTPWHPLTDDEVTAVVEVFPEITKRHWPWLLPVEPLVPDRFRRLVLQVLREEGILQ